MATTASSTSSTASAAVSTQKRGSKNQPKQQLYKARPSKTIKVWTETLKSVKGVNRLSPEQRGALAFFTLHSDRSAN